MTTFDDDFVRFNMLIGKRDVPLVALGLEWPPPELILLEDGGKAREATADDEGSEFIFRRATYSQITDEERAGMSRIIRGADYYYADIANGPAEAPAGFMSEGGS